jgi:serine/threonine protein kinase
MGDVYQATDSKLGRSVAIKLLPEAFVRDAERVARFEREARVLASLNHSNIAVIHGLEHTDGCNFLVMELVLGETLAERIKRGPVPLDEALAIAKQIAEALEAAHEKGVIHRDLKPANVRITPDGKVKVLDFGLAKAMSGANASPAGRSHQGMESETASANLSNSPTLSMAATNAGVILGTAAYMSPEQAKGRSVDKRTDIFAFGCVLYEMVTGRATFEGDDVTDILGAVLRMEPDWNRLPAGTPPAVRKLLRLCLEKNVKNRRSSATDVRLDIEEAQKDSGDIVPPASVRMKSPRLAWIFAAAFALAFGSVTAVYFSQRPPAAPEMRLEINTPSTSAPLEFALSPDGRYIVFVASGDGPQRLWLRALDKTDAQPLAGTEGANYPFWSPDSRSIGFTATGKLQRIDIAGGAPQVSHPHGKSLAARRYARREDGACGHRPGRTGLGAAIHERGFGHSCAPGRDRRRSPPGSEIEVGGRTEETRGEANTTHRGLSPLFEGPLLLGEAYTREYKEGTRLLSASH